MMLKKQNRVMIGLLLLIVVFFLGSCKYQDKLMNEYPSLRDKNHLFINTTPAEILELLKDDQAKIIVFSFPACPWCQAALPYINEIAKEYEYQAVYYLDIQEMRDNSESLQHQQYLEIYEMIRYDIGNPDYINAPTVIVTKNQEIQGYHTDTVLSHVKNDNGILEPMNDEQIQELKQIYRQLFMIGR